MSPRRLEFRIAALRSGKKMYDVARELGVSYNHLCLVLDGGRKGSQRLEDGIAAILKTGRTTPGSQAPTEIVAVD